MARTGRPTAKLVLSDEERQTLQRWARRPKSAQALALRARIVLACAEGATNKDVAAEFSVTAQMVGKWRARFVADRLAGLSDDDRPGRPRTITDAQVEQVVTATLEQAPPDDGTHWSTRMMAAHTGLTQTAVSRIWRAFELKPDKVDYWKLSTDPHFVDKLYDVGGLYLDPPERALVLCVDEKSQVQALDRSAPVLPMMPAAPERQTHTYIRHGHPPRHDQPVRRTRCGHRPRLQQPAPPAPGHRVPHVPQPAQPRGPRRARRAPHPGQLRHPQNAPDPPLARPPPPLPSALHPDHQLVAEPRRTALRRTLRPGAPPRRPPQ